MRRWTRALLAGAVAGLLGVAFALTPLGLALERAVGLGALFWLRGPIEPPADVVVVGMDRESADRLGLPAPPRLWPRSVHARLIEALTRQGVAVIALDLRLDVPGPEADDAALAEAIAAAERVVLFQHLDRMRQTVAGGDGRAAGQLTVDRLVPPRPAFAEGAMGLGPFPLPKVPARVDRFWTFKAAAGETPTLPAVALVLHALDAYDPLLELLRRAGASGLDDGWPAGRAGITTADGVLAVCGRLRRLLRDDPGLGARLRAALTAAEADGALSAGQRRRLRALIDLHGGPDSRYLNFYGPPGSVRTIPYHAALADGGDGLDLAGKVVFVGLSDLSGTETKEDGFRTVFSRADGVDLSGVEIAATAFANLLDGRSVRPTGTGTTLGLLLLAGGVGGAAALLLPVLPAVLLVLLTVALYGLGAHLAFAHADLWPPLAIPVLLQLPLALGWGLADRYRRVSRERRNIDRGARMYLPARLVQEMATAETADPSARNETVYGVCLLSDIEGYTPLAERLAAPELAALMNGYFEAVVGAVRRHDGVVSDMIGDGLLCIWTAPQPDPVSRAKACAAAVDLARAVEAFNARAPHRLPTRIGLNAGMTLLGHVGGGGRFAYGVVGDVVNTASRIEGLNKQLGTRVLAAAGAVEGVPDLLLRPLGRFLLVGKSEPLAVVEIRGRADGGGDAADPVERALCARFAYALDAFAAGRWREAARLFEAVLAAHPGDGPSRFYLELARRYAAAFEPAAAAAAAADPAVVRVGVK